MDGVCGQFGLICIEKKEKQVNWWLFLPIRLFFDWENWCLPKADSLRSFDWNGTKKLKSVLEIMKENKKMFLYL